MSISIDNDANCAVYRSNDPINNFKIRYTKSKFLEILIGFCLFLFSVKLERLTSSALLPSLQRLKIEEDLSRLLNIDGKRVEKAKASRTDTAQAMNETKRSEYEEVVVGWQQKLFSRV